MARESESGVYAIVRSGSRQHKVCVGDVLEIDRVNDEVGSSIKLQPLMVIDDEKVIADPKEIANSKVTAEVLGQVKGPKLKMMKYKNKSGYKRRIGHRQQYTQVKITEIEG